MDKAARAAAEVKALRALVASLQEQAAKGDVLIHDLQEQITNLANQRDLLLRENESNKNALAALQQSLIAQSNAIKALQDANDAYKQAIAVLKAQQNKTGFLARLKSFLGKTREVALIATAVAVVLLIK